MLILTIGLVALAGLLAVSLRMQQLGRNETQAVRLAQDKLDQLMSLDFDGAAAIQINAGADPLAANVANYFDTDVQGYTRRWRIESGPDSVAGPVADLRVITIRVIPTVTDRRTASPYDLVSIIRAATEKPTVTMMQFVEALRDRLLKPKAA